MARVFCVSGAALGIVGVVLWIALPIHFGLPPYFFTPILAVGYGFWCWRRGQAPAVRKEARE